MSLQSSISMETFLSKSYHRTKLLTLSIIGMVMFSCARTPNISDIPEIEFISLSKNVMRQGIQDNDSLNIIISFTDGDGDLSSPEPNIFVIDNRTDEVYASFSVPEIPTSGLTNGIVGTIEMTIFNSCCIYPDGFPPCERNVLFPENELTLDIYMIDRAGNKSNTVTTPVIRLLCD
jgi:hypothetical protein